MDLSKHVYRCGPNENLNVSDEDIKNTRTLRTHIEPWLSAVFQSEHLSLLVGSGLSCAVAGAAGEAAIGMAQCDWRGIALSDKVNGCADQSALACGRGAANFEDQLRAAMQLQAGLEIQGDDRAGIWSEAINEQLRLFMSSILESERTLLRADDLERDVAESLLTSFLLSFASRTATRERLNLFTTNYDRFIEYGCDLAGLHVLDRFVGTLAPIFRASRLNLDVHYNPPGIRGEPRYLEGVVRLSKIHGSLDWRWQNQELRRFGVPFGANPDPPDLPAEPSGSVMIYPNAAKDVETLDYPYAELFRDFAAAICRPNSALVTYGYGFGDDHVNRIVRDMLTIPSTHLVVIAYDQTEPLDLANPANASRQRIIKFCEKAGRQAQVSLLLGSHFGDLERLVLHYLPKPAIDQITIRKAKIEENRGERMKPTSGGGDGEQTD